MQPTDNVIYHILQRETSHSQVQQRRGKFHIMEVDEVFRANLLALMEKRGLTEAALSKKAGLNARAVTDIREMRTKSPKLSTVFRLAEALNADPAEMMGLGSRHKLNADLAAFLGQFDEADQSRFLGALSALHRQPD